MQSLQQEEKIYTTAATKLRQQIDALKYDDPERDELYDQMSKMHEEGTDLTPEAQAIYKESDSIGAVLLNRRLKFVKEDSSIAGYSILVELIQTEISEQKEDDLHRALEVYNDVYKTKYPDHPYVTVVESYVNASSVKVGNHYTDVAAIDSDGKEVKLSELINGKTALIHLWASWCGPCRQHGKEMIPIYEEYKDKGFIVVGIAREKGRNTMLNAVNQDKYPWVNLLEINDVHGIWAKFGVGNAGGADFLVDKNGNFLAVKTSPAVVKIILQNTFGN
jgi:thiol-disulfide isomerase/thioredoxin